MWFYSMGIYVLMQGRNVLYLRTSFTFILRIGFTNVIHQSLLSHLVYLDF